MGYSRDHGLAARISAAGQGLEPRYHPPEGCVLPLDDPAILDRLTGKLCLPLDDPAM